MESIELDPLEEFRKQIKRKLGVTDLESTPKEVHAIANYQMCLCVNVHVHFANCKSIGASCIGCSSSLQLLPVHHHDIVNIDAHAYDITFCQ